jgi:hypothetical protein
MFLVSWALPLWPTIFVFKKQSKKKHQDYFGFNNYLYPLLPAIFIFFLLTITIRVLYQPAAVGSSRYGLTSVLDFHFIFVMRRLG